MQVIRVIPLAALPPTVPQVLDYFWTSPLSVGALVKVTVGRRAVDAIVVECLDLARAKLAIKKGSFGLKKISGVLTELPQATPHQLSLAQWMSRQYAAGLTSSVKTVLPSWLGKRGKILQLPEPKEPRKQKIVPHLILTQPNTALDRIREQCAAATGQVLIVVPEMSLARHLEQALEDLAPVAVHSDLTARQYFAAYTKALDGSAKVIIGTRLGLFLPFHDLCAVIVEDPLHEAYKSDMSPRYVTADTARELSRLCGASLTYLTPALSTANRYLADKKILTVANDKPHWPHIVMADMGLEQERGNRSLLSRAAQDLLLDNHDTRQRLLFLSPRRAFSSMLLCQSCRKPVLCTTCDIPMRMHRYSQDIVATEDMLVCYHCAAYTQLPKHCPTCNGGPLRPAGLAGSQKIAQAINECLDRHGLSKIRVPILDSDLAKTDEQEDEVLARLDGAEHHILVATQKIFSHRYLRGFDAVVVMGADALAYNPDFRTQERLVYQLEKLADLKPTMMVIQHWDTHGALGHASDRSWNGFYDEELIDRKALKWPPFTRIVKLTFAHRDQSVSVRMAAIAADRLTRAAAHLKVSKGLTVLGPTPALVEKAGGRWAQHLILKSSLEPDALRELLAHVPPGAIIDIDPRSIT